MVLHSLENISLVNQLIGTLIACLQVLLTFNIFIMELNLNKQKMVKKVLFVTIFFLVALFNLNGQIQKKTLIVGGEINIPLTPQDDEYQFKIAPTFGYFIAKNLVVGAEFETQINSWLGARRYNIGAGPLIRYYVGKSKFQAFAHTSYVGLISFFNTSSSKYYYSHLKAGIGAHYLLIPTVGIEALLAYDYIHTNEELAQGIPDPHLALHFGFQIFLPPKSIDN